MAFNLATYLSQNAAGVGVLGAIVGGSAQAAKSFRDHKRGLISRKQAFRETGNEAAGAGVATAASAVAAGVVGGGLILSMGTAFVAAAAVKFAWDRGMEAMASMRSLETVVEAEVVE